MLIEVQIECLLIDTITDQPVIMLQELDGERTLPIVIGLSEAGAIASELEQISFPRPMTHDLLLSSIRELGGVVEAVVINDLKDSTFYARMVVRQSGTRHEIDARPSDAIAVAVRCSAPIYADDSVVESVSANRDQPVGGETGPVEDIIDEPPLPPIVADGDPEELKKMLEELNPDDFGKYKM